METVAGIILFFVAVAAVGIFAYAVVRFPFHVFAAVLIVAFLFSCNYANAATGSGLRFNWWALTWFTIFLVALVLTATRSIRHTHRLTMENIALQARVTLLENESLAPFVLCDVLDVEAHSLQNPNRLVTVRFGTYAGMLDFQNWLLWRARAVRREATA